MKLKPLLPILAAVGLSACAGNGATSPHAATNAEQAGAAISTAKAAVQKAALVGYEWRDTGKLISRAEDALKASDFEKAGLLAHKAQRQADLGHVQYHTEQVRGAIKAAEAAVEKAAAVGYAWRDTGKIITKAEAALEADNYKKAIHLAVQAQRQGELGYAQYLAQKGAAKR